METPGASALLVMLAASGDHSLFRFMDATALAVCRSVLLGRCRCLHALCHAVSGEIFVTAASAKFLRATARSASSSAALLRCRSARRSLKSAFQFMLVSYDEESWLVQNRQQEMTLAFDLRVQIDKGVGNRVNRATGSLKRSTTRSLSGRMVRLVVGLDPRGGPE